MGRWKRKIAAKSDFCVGLFFEKGISSSDLAVLGKANIYHKPRKTGFGKFVKFLDLISAKYIRIGIGGKILFLWWPPKKFSLCNTLSDWKSIYDICCWSIYHSTNESFLVALFECCSWRRKNLLLNLILLFVFLSLSIILNWVWLVSHRTVKFTGGLDFIGWTYLRPLYWSTCSANDHLLAAYVARYPYFPTLEISAQKRGITPQGWEMKWQTDKNLAQISNKINITSRPGAKFVFPLKRSEPH